MKISTLNFKSFLVRIFLKSCEFEASSKAFVINVLFINIDGIKGYFLLCKNLLIKDQYTLGANFGSFSLLPSQEMFLSLASEIRLALKFVILRKFSYFT